MTATTRPWAPPLAPRNDLGAHDFARTFADNINPNLMQLCPLVRTRPDLVRAVIRDALLDPWIYVQAAGFGYSKGDFVDPLTTLYSDGLAIECS